jgi:hypothetical protein
MRRSAVVAWWLLVATAAGACGSSRSAPGIFPADDANTVEFCRKWKDATESGDDEKVLTVLEDAPSVLHDAAAEVIRAQRAEEDSDSATAAAHQVFTWLEINCNPNAASPNASGADRRFAIPAHSTTDQFLLCLASSAPAVGPSGGGVVLYGESARSDPYTGPMLGVFWGTGGEHSGDGDTTPVRVRGTDGVAAPITVFQQVILDELGTVIAWHEGDLSVGLYGRLWDQSRTDELVAVADSLEFVDGGFRLQPGALPAGYKKVFEGSPDFFSLVLPVNATYQVQYRTTDGQAGIFNVSGFLASPDEFEAFRFFTLDLERTNSGGRDSISGNAWNAGGPGVVTWREDDGLVIRVLGLQVDLKTVQEAAAATRELTRSEWVELVEKKSECPELRP